MSCMVNDVSRPPSLSLSDLPSDVLAEIVCRLPCEVTLLGAVAKLNREFREISTDPHTRKCVKESFFRVHKEKCRSCRNISENGPFLVDPSTFNGSLGCVMFFSAFATGASSAMYTILHCAATHGHADAIRYVVGEEGAADLLCQKDLLGRTVLHLAAGSGHVGVIRYVLEECGALDMLSEPDNFGATLVHKAAEAGRTDILRYVAGFGGSCSDLFGKADNYGQTVLHAAAARGHVSVMRYVIEETGHAALVNAENVFRRTVLHEAVQSAHCEAMRYIVEGRRATHLLRRRDSRGETPLDMAKRMRKDAHVRYLSSKL
eukprot:Rmarinus@m.7167